MILGRFGGRSTGTSTFSVQVGNQQFTSDGMSSVNMTNGESTYARVGGLFETFTPQGNSFDVTLTYNASGEYEGYVDYLTMNVRRQLIFTGSQMSFRDKNTLAHASSTFSLSNPNGATIWDITDRQNPVFQENSNGTFGTETTTLKEFVAFNGSANLLSAEAVARRFENG